MQKFNFTIKNENANELDIYIDGSIVDAETQEWLSYFGSTLSQSYKSLRDQINKSEASIINIYINSGGGNVAEAMAMHDFIVELQNKGKTVNTFGRGIVASAATYILMASKNSSLSENSWFMIHNVSGLTYGDVNEMENYATTMRKFNNQIRDFYVNATGLKESEITDMMNAETWMTAEEAKDKGFTKQVDAKVNFTNAIDKKQWMFENMEVLQAYNSCVASAQPVNPQQSFFNQLENNIMKFFNKAFKKIKDAETPENKVIVDAVEKAFEDAEAELEPIVNALVKKALKNSDDDADEAGDEEDTDDAPGEETAKPAKVAKKAKAAEKAAEDEDDEEEGAPDQSAKDLANALKEIKALKNDISLLKGAESRDKSKNKNAEAAFGDFT